MKLSGRVAIITGAAGGIGRAIALEYSREGAKVVVADYAEVGGKETVRLIEAVGGKAIFVQTDVSKENDIDTMVSKAVETFGGVDILVNNAGVLDGLKSIKELTVEEWNRIIGINLSGPFMGAKRVIPEMEKKGKGVIINTGSIASLAGGRGGPAYTATKHGVLGLSRQLAHLHAKDGIRVNTICPGGIKTSIGQGITNINHPLVTQQKTPPAGRMGKPEEIAKVALFLASDDASYIHGEEIVVDGGWNID